MVCDSGGHGCTSGANVGDLPTDASPRGERGRARSAGPVRLVQSDATRVGLPVALTCPLVIGLLKSGHRVSKVDKFVDRHMVDPAHHHVHVAGIEVEGGDCGTLLLEPGDMTGHARHPG